MSYLHFIFSEKEKSFLYDKLKSFWDPEKDIEKSLFDLFNAKELLAKELLKKIFDFKRNISSPWIIYIENSPIDISLPETPVNARKSKDKKSFISENLLLLFWQIIWEPIWYKLEKQWELIHNMCPVKKNENTISNEWSLVNQQFHVEHVYLWQEDMSVEIKNYSPDYFLLFCLKQDFLKEAITWYLHISDILTELTIEDIDILRKPLFKFKTAYSFTWDNQKLSKSTSIIDWNLYRPNFYCDFWNWMVWMDDRSKFVLDKLYKIINNSDKVIEIKLKPWDIMIVNNRKWVHYRSRFNPDYSREDRRWIQRLYIKNSLSDFYPVSWNIKNINRIF